MQLIKKRKKLAKHGDFVQIFLWNIINRDNRLKRQLLEIFWAYSKDGSILKN